MQARTLKSKMLAVLDEHIGTRGNDRRVFVLHPFKNAELRKVREFVASFNFGDGK